MFANRLRSFIKLIPVNLRFSSNLTMPSAVVVLPTGAEEIEFVGTVDVLRRAGVRKFLFASYFYLFFNNYYLYRLL